MTHTRTIEVIKRDNSREEFSVPRLSGVIWRAQKSVNVGRYRDAWELSRAIEIFLRRRKRRRLTSGVIFEMTIKSLRRVRMGEAAEILELHRTLRNVRRRLLRVRHEDGTLTQWDKSWMADLGQRMWHIERPTARTIAGLTELELLPQEERSLDRRQIVDAFNRRVAEFGLADAVPVHQFTAETR